MNYFLAIVTLAVLTINTQAEQECPPNEPCNRILRFAEYGNIWERDERGPLDSLAVQFRKEPGSIIYVRVYAGQKSCINEAAKRGIRARNYLIRKHGIPGERIVWKDGGFRVDLSTELWLLPEKIKLPEAYPMLERDHVKIVKKCKLPSLL